MAVEALFEGFICATDVNHAVSRALSCDGGFVHHGKYLALSVERAGGGPLAVAARFVFVAVRFDGTNSFYQA